MLTLLFTLWWELLKCVMCINPFDPHNYPMWQALLLSSLFYWETYRDTEIHMSKLTQALSARSGIWVQVVWPQSTLLTMTLWLVCCLSKEKTVLFFFFFLKSWLWNPLIIDKSSFQAKGLEKRHRWRQDILRVSSSRSS